MKESLPIFSQPAESPQQTAACCAEFYEQDLVQDLLGVSFHPGGLDLSARLVHSMNLPNAARVLDVACGIGSTTLLMARQFGLNPTGVDFSVANIEKARGRSALLPHVQIDFQQQDAGALSFPDGQFDAIVCECALSTFAEQPRVVEEFARVLRSGGVVGMTDMVVDGELPEDIAQHIGPWTCLTDARSAADYQQLFLDAGFVATHYIDESQTLLELLLTMKRKLLGMGLGKALEALPGVNLDLSSLRALLAKSKALIDEGTIQYCRMVYSKGRPTRPIPPNEPAPLSVSACDCAPGSDC